MSLNNNEKIVMSFDFEPITAESMPVIPLLSVQNFKDNLTTEINVIRIINIFKICI